MIESVHPLLENTRAQMPEAYSPKDDLDYTLRYWWLLVLLMLIGVGLGWVFDQFAPPLYEARAEITISIDITRTGTLTGENQDMVIDSVGDIIGSSAVKNALQQDFPPSANTATFLERKADRFALRVEARDPQAAVEIASRWSQLALAKLDDASLHVIAADILQRSIANLSTCIEQLPSAGSDPENCAHLSFAGIQILIQESGKQLRQENADSLGLIPGIRYWISQTPMTPTQPVQYNRKYLLLGGSLIGFVTGLWLLHLRLPDRIGRSKPRD